VRQLKQGVDMKKLVMAAVSFSATTILLGGVALATPSGGITGPGSKSIVKVKNIQVCSVVNENSVGVSNTTKQKAKTGSATVKHNTTGGSAGTGDAANGSATVTTLALTNSSPCVDQGSVIPELTTTSGITGPHSLSVMDTKNVNKVEVVNSNYVMVGSTTTQSANSGSATVQGNTTGGDATTGGASNTSTTGTIITITNN
jgi:hypothetical protein